MKASYESIANWYLAHGATEDDILDATDNAVELLQDKYGYENVTVKEYLEVTGAGYEEYLTLFGDSLEGNYSSNNFRNQRK